MVRFATEKETLDEAIRRLVAAIDPDKIVLFGSRARGDAQADSDFDLRTVKQSSDRTYKRVVPAKLALYGIGAAVEVMWKTPDEVERWKNVRSHPIAQALLEGRIVYERP
jgi:predicted nucleotidyltransferase